MENERWRKTEDIFHTALSLDNDDRANYFRDLVASDPQLFAEVTSLVAAYENESGFLDTPILDLGLSVIYQEAQEERVNTVVGVYAIGEKLGSGGMGDVYHAIDTRLNRQVALKFLSDSLKDDGAAKRQLQKEAQAIAMLEHPNICTVYGIEQGIDGENFLAMQFIDGITLEKKIKGMSLDLASFRSIALQIAGAVAFAHSHGVIHRDLKPGNIMLSDDGNIKVLDFGLAKIIEQKTPVNAPKGNSTQMSQNGLVIGTIAYMSPEQLRGEKLDYQSDIFSLGVILHELLTRINPFQRETQAETIAAILSNDSINIKKNAPTIPVRIADLINGCIQRDKGKRFKSVDEILIELESLDAGRPRYRAMIGHRTLLKFAILTFATLIASVGLFVYFSRAPQITVAVLPVVFENPQSESDHLADDLTQSVIDKLSNLSDLKIKGDYFISRYRGKDTDPQRAGHELNVQAVFTGTIQNRPDGLFLKTQTIRTLDGVLIDTDEMKIDETNVIGLSDEIASRIVTKINLRLSDKDRNRLAKKDTESSEAKNYYLAGRYYMKRRKSSDDLEKAIQAFTNAKDIDQNYARAWAGLADAYLSQSSTGAKRALTPGQAVEFAKLAAKRAIDLDNTLCDSYNSLGLISARYDWNWKEAENYFRLAINQDREFLPAHFGLINVLKLQERYDEALSEANKVKELDPLSINADIQVALIDYRRRDYDETDRVLSELLQRSPDDPRVKYVQVYQFLKTDRTKEAIDILEPLYNSTNEQDKTLAAAPLGFAYAKMGLNNKALAVVGTLEEFGKNSFVPAQEKALIYVALGNFDKVFENLRLSCSERFSSLPGWVNDPIVDDVKNDQRFAEIKKCVNL